MTALGKPQSLLNLHGGNPGVSCARIVRWRKDEDLARIASIERRKAAPCLPQNGSENDPFCISKGYGWLF